MTKSMHQIAVERDQAIKAGQKTVPWHKMKVWLRANVKTRTASALAAKKKARTAIR